MLPQKFALYVVKIGVMVVLLVGCGGSGGSNQPPPPPPSSSFTLSLSTPSITVPQGGASQGVQVSVLAQGGFDGTVSVTVPSLPSGVTYTPVSLSVTPGSPGTFSISASSAAQIVQESVSVEGVSGNLNASASLQLKVTGSPVPDPFHLVGGVIVHGYYDEMRQLLFVTNPGLNELDVISGQDFSIMARVPVPQPWGIDQMADGNTLVIGTEAQEILTVNEDTLQVTAYPYSAKGIGSFALFFPNVVAMANGKVFLIGQEQGIDSSDILDGGQYVYEWNSTTNTFSLPSMGAGNGSSETDSLARSADHKWAVFASDQFYLYSSDSDSFSAASLTAVNPPSGEFGVRGYAINGDGAKIAVASATQVTFLDHSLAVLGTTPIPGAFQTARTAVQFSQDGGRLYLQYDLPIAVEEIDSSSFSALGYLSAVVNPENNEERLLATDSQGRGFFGIAGGVRVVDLTAPLIANTANGNFSVPSCAVPPTNLSLNKPAQATFSGAISGINVYVGGQPAAVLSGGTTLNIPASSNPGLADVECIGPDGNTSVVAGDVSYGVTIAGISASLLPASKNPSIDLFGYGFSGTQGEIPTVTIAGQPALNVGAVDSAGPGAIQGTVVQIPNGSAGEQSTVGVTSSLGTGTLTAAATYYESPTILPATGLLQLTFDTRRNLLYALKATEVDVLNPSTLQWGAPFTFPASATGTFGTMALSPDGTKLVVAGSTGSALQFVVLDPDNVASPSVINYSRTLSSVGSMAITKFNTVIILGPPSLALDLATSQFTPLPYFGGQVIKTSADGSRMYAAALNIGNGEVDSIDPSTYQVQTQTFGELFWTDLAVSPDGSQFAAVFAPPYLSGDIVGFFDSGLRYLNTNVYPAVSPSDDTGVLGATYSPGGRVLLVPLGDSIEFWNSQSGTLIGRLMTPEELRVFAYPESVIAPALALDSTGQTIYVLSQSGLTILKLPVTLDEMTSVQWQGTVNSNSIQTMLKRSAASKKPRLRRNRQN
jgi:hypothetical protein